LNAGPAPEPIGFRAAVRLLLRTLRYVHPVRGRMATKAVLTAISLVPMLLAPWPVKILLDHVILDHPIRDAHYPALLQPAIGALDGSSPLAVLGWVSLALLGMIVCFGAFGSSGAERDITEAGLAVGGDTATQTENQANLGFSLAGGLFGLFDFRWTLRLTQDLNHHYRALLFERIHSLPMRAFDDARVGDAIYRVMYDTPAITGLAYEVLLTPFVTLVQIVLTAWLLWDVYPEHAWLTALALLATPVVLAASLPFGGLLRRRGDASRRAGSETTAALEEGVANVRAVQSLGGTEREIERFDQRSLDSFAAYRALVRSTMVTVLAVGGGVTLLAVLLVRLITDLVITGGLSAGDFAVLSGYGLQIGGYSSRLGQVWIRVQGNLAGLARVFWLMDLPPERDAPGARPLAPVREGVRLRGVHYRYPDGPVALRGVDLDAPLGKITALCGPAGAGKTTLAALVPRFIEPERGSVEIDGVDLREVTRESLRSQIAFVFQETALFDATVEENIRVGKPDASDLEVERAARIAGAHEFVRALPLGYRTPLGRAGDKLSVGQKQRLAIARALVREARILILDEPTSALDSVTERELVASLRAAARGRVVIVIAHRLASIRNADQIVFLDQGKVVERGTHDELIARPGGAYRRFVELEVLGAA
jgi:ABC-type multidrug transport system fused ATPase/permease subunit